MGFAYWLGEFIDIPNSRQNRSENKLVCKNAVTRVQVAQSGLWASHRFSRDNRTTSANSGGDVFERRMSTGSELFSLLICLDATKFVLLSIFTLRDDLSKNLFKITAEESKTSTSG